MLSLGNIKDGSKLLSRLSGEERNRALIMMGKALLTERERIKKANDEDISSAVNNNLPDSVIQRLKFSDTKIESSVEGIESVASLPDPLGRVLVRRQLDDGLILEKVTFPIGVIALVFEARPDALIQIASLALKTGNAVILKGGSEASSTNRVLVDIISSSTRGIIDADWIIGIESHSDVDEILKSDEYIDLVIPRGSGKFVRYVMDHTKIPVLGHSDGICSVYVDEYAALDKALKIVVDSKTQYPAACNSAETILVHSGIAPDFLPALSEAFKKKGVKVRADNRSLIYFPGAKEAVEEDFFTEFLSLECAIKIVDSIDEAIEHIAEHSSHHTDSIVTENIENKEKFFKEVDSADVFANCSTRFADGFRFGLGAEVGISTGKIHARGPVGPEGLVTTKYLLSGSGETVAEYSGPDGKKFKHRDLL